MIEKIIQQIKNAKPEEIKTKYEPFKKTYTINNKEGFEFELKRYIGSQSLGLGMLTIYDLNISKEGKYLMRFSSYWDNSEKIDEKKLDELCNYLENKIKYYEKHEKKKNRKQERIIKSKNRRELNRILQTV